MTETSVDTDFGKINTMVRDMAASGDPTYAMAGSCDRDSFALAIEGSAYAMDELPYVDLSNPWWSQKQNASLTFGGKNYIAYNDFMLSGLDSTDVMVFNKTVEGNYGLDIYTLVEDGGWTWDKLREYGTMVTADVDGNGTWDENDQYGWIIGMKNVPSTVWVSSGVMAVSKDEKDYPVFAQGDMERFFNCLENAYNFSWNDTFWYGRQAAHNVDNIIDPPLFATDKALFMSCGLGTLSSAYFREMESDYGIIPQPKYDETQTEYCTRTQGGFVHIVPISYQDTEFVGAIMEALAFASMQSVKPQYYEMALKGKFSRDEQSGRVLDMLIESRVSDYADTILRSFIVDGFILQKAQSGKPIQASDIESNQQKVNAQIEKFIEQHEARSQE